MLTFFIKIPGHSTLPPVCKFFEKKPEDEQHEQGSHLEDSMHIPSNVTFSHPSSKAVAAEIRRRIERNSSMDVSNNAHSAMVNRVPKEIGTYAIDDSSLPSKQKECDKEKTSISSGRCISRNRRSKSNSSFF